MNKTVNGDALDAKSLRRLFAGFRARIVSEPLTDFSRLHRSCEIFCEVQPASVEELCGIVRLAARHGIPVRTRGNGHALNGSSLPRTGELLVRMLSICHAHEPQDGAVWAGSGCVLWYLDAWLRSKGYALPVINAGYAGPTVGGFVAAGGFGRNSASVGGFWNNVAGVTLVDGAGDVEIVRRHDPLFPWLFGAMGQLGIVAEAKLDVVTHDPTRGRIAEPLGQKETAPTGPARDEAGRLFWFTMFVPDAYLDEACRILDDLEKENLQTFHLRDRYTYRIAHHMVVAPLVWPEATSCYAVGSWGLLQDTSPDRMGRVLAFDADFMRAVHAKGYRRYVQSEVPSGPHIYARCFGNETYATFRGLKAARDPYELLNRGWVFPATVDR